jgi:gamma-glutamylcyclotransferase (GGCT)/AIG2-like uncharacterized protein YtfP
MRGFEENWQRKTGAHFVARGTIQGKLYDLGDFPGVLETDGGQAGRVAGELYQLSDPELALKTLDQYEEFFRLDHDSSLFVRKVALVNLENRGSKDAWVYFYNQKVDERALIPSGDYRDKASVGSPKQRGR